MEKTCFEMMGTTISEEGGVFRCEKNGIVMAQGSALGAYTLFCMTVGNSIREELARWCAEREKNIWEDGVGEMAFEDLQNRYPDYGRMISRAGYMIRDGKASAVELIEAAVGWVKKKVEPEDRADALARFAVFCARLERERAEADTQERST